MESMVVQYGGWVAAVASTLFAGFATFRKSKVDESSQAIQAWKEITDRHENEINDLKKELVDANTETFMLRRRLKEVEDECYEERKEFRREIETLHRQILQLHASYLAQMTILADPTNPDHANLIARASALLEQATRAYEN